MLADLGGRRQHPIVWHAPLDVQERDAERHEERDPGDRHDARAPHHAGREAMPEAFSNLYLTAMEQLQRVDSRSEHGEQCRQRHHGDHHGDHEDADAAVGERSQEVQREDQERAQRDRHRDRTEGDGAPGRLDRADHGLVDRAPAGAFLAESTHDEQRVVDGEAEPKGGHEVDREDRDVRELCDGPEHHERAEHRDCTDQQREPGGDHTAEDEQQQQQRERDGDHLRTSQVALDRLADRSEHRLGACQPDADAVTLEAGVLVEDRLDRLDARWVLLGAGKAHEDQRPVALDRAQRRRRAERPVRRNVVGALDRREFVGQCRSSGDDVRSVDVALGRRHDRDEIRAARVELVVECRDRPSRLGPGVVEAAVRQLPEHSGAEHDGHDEPEQRGRQHRAPTANDQVTQSGEHGVFLRSADPAA